MNHNTRTGNFPGLIDTNNIKVEEPHITSMQQSLTSQGGGGTNSDIMDVARSARDRGARAMNI
jgi:hypothetical protein